MNQKKHNAPLLAGFTRSDFTIRSLEDEIRVDQGCQALLHHFKQYLTSSLDLTALEAGELCHGADFFLRDFLVADRHDNLFDIDPNRIRQFGGHWYIVRSLEPNVKELTSILAGTKSFYRFLAEHDMVGDLLVESIVTLCQDTDYFKKRIDDYWTIQGDGYDEWREACPLETVKDS